MQSLKRTTFIQLEAATPDQIKSGGAGWSLSAGFAQSPFGSCLVAEGLGGIFHLSFVKKAGDAAALKELQREWPHAVIQRDDKRAAVIVKRIFKRRDGKRFAAASPLRAFVKGTEFQVRVWRALLSVPRGAPTTYGNLARLVKKPGASRAVGSAVGANPVAYLIPCHRVIRGTGALGGYHWGPSRKKAMLAWESLG